MKTNSTQQETACIFSTNNYPFASSKTKSVRFFRTAFCLLVLLFASATLVEAQTKTWDGQAGTSNWNDANNWNPNGVPTASDAVNLNTSSSNNVNIIINTSNAVCASLRLGGTSPNTAGRITFASSGSPKLTVSGTVTVGGSGSTSNNRRGEITFVSGATLEANQIVLTQSTAGSDNPGIITMTAGSTLITGSFVVGQGTTTWTPSTGTVILKSNNTLPATVFNTFHHLTFSAGTTIAAAALTINGDITIASGAGFTGGAYTHNVAGDWINNGGTFTNTGTTVNMNGAAQEIAGSASTTFNHLTIASTTSTTLARNITIEGNLNVTASDVFDLSTFTCNRTTSGGTLTVAGTLKLSGSTGGLTGSNFPSNFSTFTNTGGTVEFYGNNAQTVPALNYNNLTLSGSRGAQTLTLASTGTVGVAGTFTPSATFTSGSYETEGSTINFNGATQTIPQFAYHHLTRGGTSGQTATINANLSIAGNLTISSGNLNLNAGSSNRSISVTGDWIQSGGAVDFFEANNENTVTTTVNLQGDLTVSSGTVTSDGLTGNNGLINFSGSSEQTISFTNPANITYTNFTVSSGAIVKLASNLNLTEANSSAYVGTFTVATEGILNAATYTISGSGSRSSNAVFNLNSGATLITANVNGVTGTSASLNPTASTLTLNLNAAANYQFNGTATQVTTGLPSIINNLEINNTAGSTGVTLSANVQVNGTLILTSGLLTTGSNTVTVAWNSSDNISGGSATAYVSGKLQRQFSTTAAARVFPIGKGGVYRPVAFEYTSNPGSKSVTIEQFESAFPTAVPSNASVARFGSRYWNILQSAIGSPYKVQLTGSSQTPTGTVQIIKREGSATATTHATTAPDFTNTTAFSTTQTSNDVSLIETAIPLTVTGVTVSNKTYNANTTAVFNVSGATLNGVVSGDVVTFSTGAATAAFPTANAGDNLQVAFTGFSIAGANAGAYVLSQPVVTASILPFAVTVTASAQSKTYGQTLNLGTTAFTTTAMVGADVVNGVTLTSTGTPALAAAGTYPVVPNAVTLAIGNPSNYSFTYVNGTLTVNKASLTVTALDTSFVYNGTNFTGGNGVAFTGFVNGETQSVLTGALNYTGTSQLAKNAGTYTLTPQGWTSLNYNLTFVSGTLTISKASLSIAARDTTKNQGVVLVNVTSATGFTAIGLVAGETVGSVVLTFGEGKAAGAEPGVYDGSVVPSAASGGTFLAANYTISYTAGSITVYTVVGILPSYRTRAAGNFNNKNTWEVEDFPDWVPADEVPTSGSNIEIRHAVNLNMNFIVGRGKTFEITGSGTMTINAGHTFSVEGTANFGGKAVVLESNAQGTAALGQIFGTLTGATNVTVERYIGNNKRAWRLLTIPVTGTTIRQAWAGRAANGNAPVGETAGTGTLLTGHFYTNGATAAAAGYDWFTANANQPSNIRFYSFVGGTASWNSATNTPNVLNAPDKQGYMVFIRGDRTFTSGNAASRTTLRPTGTLKTGNQTVAVNASYVMVGNPYASAISMEKVYLNTGNSDLIERNFWIWDARLGASGGYRALSWNGTGYDVTGGGNASQLLIVESGAAFFVQRKSANGMLLIQENDKATSPNNAVFRVAAPAAAAKPAPRTGKRGITGNISVNLFQLNGTTLDVQMDGVIARFGNQYSELPTEVFDLEKINNFNENLSLVRNNRYLSIESRPFPKVKDTLSLPFWGLSNRSYALQIATNGLAGAIMSAFLVDEFTQTQTLIDLTQPVFQYNFAVTTNAASKSLTRFRIVFNASPSLPVTFTDLKATHNNRKVRVDWSVGTESELEGYEVERSTDGVVFSKIGFVPATGNSNYSFTDLQPASGMNYYRIRSVDLDGSFKFSRIVSVSTTAAGGIQVYPAQVVNNQVTVQMNAIPAGAYRMQLTSASGQVVFAGMLQHNGGSSSQILDLSKANAKQGVYFLTITNGAELRETFKLIF